MRQNTKNARPQPRPIAVGFRPRAETGAQTGPAAASGKPGRRGVIALTRQTQRFQVFGTMRRVVDYCDPGPLFCVHLQKFQSCKKAAAFSRKGQPARQPKMHPHAAGTPAGPFKTAPEAAGQAPLPPLFSLYPPKRKRSTRQKKKVFHRVHCTQWKTFRLPFPCSRPGPKPSAHPFRRPAAGSARRPHQRQPGSEISSGGCLLHSRQGERFCPPPAAVFRCRLQRFRRRGKR